MSHAAYTVTTMMHDINSYESGLSYMKGFSPYRFEHLARIWYPDKYFIENYLIKNGSISSYPYSFNKN